MIETITANSIPARITSSVPVECGGILLCRSGRASMSHNFQKWDLSCGTVMAFFPNDIMHLDNISHDFMAEVLLYPPDMLRSASLLLEDVVYDWLRNDCCNTSEKVGAITGTMFDLIKLYMEDASGEQAEKILLLHLKAYFQGLYNKVAKCHHDELELLKRKDRITERFNSFMSFLETDYRTHHDVSYYASLMSITPKHLTSIARRITGKSAKEVIDEYLVMHIKLALSETSMSIKEIAWDFNFSTFAFFCRFFMRRTGMSPTRYRACCRENGMAEIRNVP